MGLFDNNFQQQQDEQKRKQEQEQRQKLEEEQEQQFNERKDFVNAQPGIICKFQYADSAQEEEHSIPKQVDVDLSPEYKFMITEDEYIFMYNFSKYSRYNQTQYEKMLANEDKHLDRTEYHAELIKTTYLPQQSEKYSGELTVKQQPIYIEFKSSKNPDIIITVKNLSQDFSVLGTFMKDIGVKNYRNIINVPEDIFSVTVVNGEEYLSKSTYVIFRE